MTRVWTSNLFSSVACNASVKFDWLADHYLLHYLEGIRKVLAATTEPSWLEQPAASRATPAFARRIDPASRGVPPPARQAAGPKRTISEAALAEAFFNQPTPPHLS